jgi:hypothetical protein
VHDYWRARVLPARVNVLVPARVNVPRDLVSVPIMVCPCNSRGSSVDASRPAHVMRGGAMGAAHHRASDEQRDDGGRGGHQ